MLYIFKKFSIVIFLDNSFNKVKQWLVNSFFMSDTKYIVVFFFHLNMATNYVDGDGSGGPYLVFPQCKLNHQISKTESNQNCMTEPEQAKDCSQVSGVLFKQKWLFSSNCKGLCRAYLTCGHLSKSNNHSNLMNLIEVFMTK